MPLRLVPEVLDAVNVVAFARSERLGVVDPHMVIALDVETVVALEGVTVDDAVGYHTFPDDGHQGLRLGIGNDLCVDLPSALQDAKNRHLPRSAPAALPLPPSAKVALIHFHFPAEGPLPFLVSGNGPPASLEEEDRRVAVHANNLGSRSRCCPCNEEFHQLIRLTCGEPAPCELHG